MRPEPGLLNQAVFNNAVWCDTVCRAHGRPGEFAEGLWLNQHETPRFYPNAVTLLPDPGSAGQLRGLDPLLAAALPGERAVKDSFCALDLAPRGFRVLFEAEWLGRTASRTRPVESAPEVDWIRVGAASELADWEMAWGGGPVAGQQRIFLPPLLDDPHVAILAGYRNQRIVAGAIANRTRQVVGLSNAFVPEADGPGCRAGCVAAAIDAFPGLALVGYERGRKLDAALALGFETLGPLRVWVRTQPRQAVSTVARN